jgi:hypothetical protein
VKLKTPGRRGWIFAAVTGVIALALPFVLPVEHTGGWWEKIPGWWAWFGGIGCAVIVLVSKWLGHRFLQKPEDWYG